MRIGFYAIVSFLIYAAAVFVGDACSAGSTFGEGVGHAGVFGTFFVLVTFPMLVAAGFFLRWAFERLARRPLPYRSTLPWFVHVPLSLAFISSVIPDSPETLFRRYVADDVPRSLSDVRYWHTSGFGNSTTVMSFRLDPAEFGKVISRYEYVERSDPGGFRPSFIEQLAESRPDFPVSLPGTPLVYEYSYSEPGPGGGLQIWHYATGAHDCVITVQSRN
jgi:hypothetical protein